MTMSKDLVVQFGVFHALLFPGVFGFVPSPTNVSVVCHNFVNVLFWNYSNPTEQLKFGVKVEPYESASQTVDTPQTYLDISSYSRDADDDYFVFVTAHDGQEKSENVSIRFTYSKDYFDEKKHKYKCSLDFPAVNTSVHKDVIEVSFQHPFMLHKQDILNEEFMYTVTHDEQKVLYSCFEDEELCTAEIHFNQSTAGQCVELKLEGMIAGIPSYTYRNVCVPQQTPETDKTGLIAALLGGGTIVLFIIMGFVWLLWRKLSKIPIIPEFLQNILPGQSPTTQPEPNAISQMTPQGHTPLLTDEIFSYGSPSISPTEKDCKVNAILDDTVVVLTEVSEVDMDCEDSEGFGRSSDYDSPKFLQEMSPGDITEGYGPRPPVI
ncbi:interferon gamma receptor 1-like b1 precursor [Sinocyclocheilus anshuiensis]|uniref:Interferon gamma receptor 1-like b1 n=1 Tax=Sinocyclocheilus anshuiensis TaxID=1608454 RepID=A0A671Q0W4_9TELE|nr:interferon gamma receptor 1-like b1 precursor [Sinocyclocheilus anshuiensis]